MIFFFILKIIPTSDGSHSVLNEELNESYHSSSGAVAESMHIFIRSALHVHPSTILNILEIGFGTGLNAYLTWIDTLTSGKKINYTAIELFPLETEFITALNYPEILKQKRETFSAIHKAPWNEETEVSPLFYLTKIKADLLDFNPGKKYDIVYFDAFSPKVQAELWSFDVFYKIFISMNPGGILTTYCSQGEVRRNMVRAGFMVEKIPGPGKKREITRAFKKN